MRGVSLFMENKIISSVNSLGNSVAPVKGSGQNSALASLRWRKIVDAQKPTVSEKLEELPFVSVFEAWDKVEQQQRTLLQKLPGEYKPLLELQLSVNSISLRTEIVSKAGESAVSSLRRLQQMGAS